MASEADDTALRQDAGGRTRTSVGASRISTLARPSDRPHVGQGLVARRPLVQRTDQYVAARVLERHSVGLASSGSAATAADPPRCRVSQLNRHSPATGMLASSRDGDPSTVDVCGTTGRYYRGCRDRRRDLPSQPQRLMMCEHPTSDERSGPVRTRGGSRASPLVQERDRGRGSLTVPALAHRAPAVVANVTNTVALTPGFVGATLAQRRDLVGQGRPLAWMLPGRCGCRGRRRLAPAPHRRGGVQGDRAVPDPPGRGRAGPRRVGCANGWVARSGGEHSEAGRSRWWRWRRVRRLLRRRRWA